MEIKFNLTYNLYTDLRMIWHVAKLVIFTHWLSFKHNTTPEAMYRTLHWAKKTGKLDP